MTAHTDYCTERAAPVGSSLHYALRFAPADRRVALAAVFALRAELERLAMRGSDSAVGQLRLAWWHDELGRLREGRPTHPITQTLQACVADLDIHMALLEELVDGQLADASGQAFATHRELALHCYRTFSTATLLAAEILGYSQRDSRKFAHEIGMAIQLTRILRDLGQSLRNQRLYLPLEALDRFGIAPSRLLQKAEQAQVQPLLAHQSTMAQQSFTQAWAHLPSADRRALRFLIILGRLHEVLLEELRHEGAGILSRRVALPPLRQLWIAWRTA